MKKMTSIGTKLFGLLEELELADHPLLFHLFSESGSTVFLALLRFVSRSDR